MAKKRVKKVTDNNAVSATVAFNCHTDRQLNETWKSKTKPSGSSTYVPDGEFRINPEDAFGNFDGDHTSIRLIKGVCTGTAIWFVIPPDDPQYFYKGTFVNPKKIRGKRTSVAAVTVTAAALADPDDWEADKTT